MKFKLELTRNDKIALAILIIFVIVVAIPVYTPKGECEIARPGYKCASAEEVMIENCEYWGQFSCNTEADVSLPQIEWYIENLCEINKMDCTNLKSACNQVTGQQTCPTFGG